MLAFLGWLATIASIASFIPKNQLKLRILALCGGLLAGSFYGIQLYLGLLPLAYALAPITTNVLIFAINGFYIIQMLGTDKEYRIYRRLRKNILRRRQAKKDVNENID